MNLTHAFWDSSALNPLCVQEATSAACQTLTSQFGLVVWWATLIEIRSAISRLHRFGNISNTERQDAWNRLSVLHGNWREIVPTDDLRDFAAKLVDKYPLRAADSLQLAAALVWCGRNPNGRTFISGDLRLCDAAALEGFSVMRTKIAVP